MVEDGTDVGEARAAKDGRVGGRGEGSRRRRTIDILSFFFSHFVRGNELILQDWHTAHAEGGGSFSSPFCWSGDRGPPLVSFVKAGMYGGSTYLLGMDGPYQKRDRNK